MYDIYLPMADASFSIPLLLAIGFGGAMISSMVGIGGGVIITSAFMSIGIPPMVAVTTQLSNSVGSNFIGFLNYHQERDVDVALGAYLFIGSMLGAFLEKFLILGLQHLASGYAIIKITVLIMVIFSGLFLFYDIHRSKAPLGLQKGAPMRTWMIYFPLHRIFLRARVEMSVLVPILVGCVTGMLTMSLGGSNSILISPILTYLLGRHSPAVTGTALLAGLGINIIVTILITMGGGTIDFLLLLIVSFSGAFGSTIGAQLSYRFSKKLLSTFGALILFAIAFKMWFELDAVDFKSLGTSMRFMNNFESIKIHLTTPSQSWLLPVVEFAHNKPNFYTYILLGFIMALSLLMQRLSSWLCTVLRIKNLNDTNI